VSGSARRIGLALALAGSLAATGWVASQDDSATPAPGAKTPEPARAKAVAAQSRAGAVAPPAGPEPELTLDKLHRKTANTKPGNLFESDTWAPPPPKVVVKQGPPPAPVPPPLPFKYFGKMSEGGQTTVFLDAADRSYAVRVGDVLDGRYKVEDIKDRLIVLTYLPLQQRQTLTIGD
jgi:hypothetical protein